jgi:hypothetical protein
MSPSIEDEGNNTDLKMLEGSKKGEDEKLRLF